MRQIHFQHISRGWTQTSEYLPIPLKDPIYSSPATSVRSPNCYLLINKNLQDHSSPDMSNIWNTSVDQTGKQDIWSDTYPVSDTKKKKTLKTPITKHLSEWQHMHGWKDLVILHHVRICQAPYFSDTQQSMPTLTERKPCIFLLEHWGDLHGNTIMHEVTMATSISKLVINLQWQDTKGVSQIQTYKNETSWVTFPRACPKFCINLCHLHTPIDSVNYLC